MPKSIYTIQILLMSTFQFQVKGRESPKALTRQISFDDSPLYKWLWRQTRDSYKLQRKTHRSPMEGKRQLDKRDFGKRLSLDSSLVTFENELKRANVTFAIHFVYDYDKCMWYIDTVPKSPERSSRVYLSQLDLKGSETFSSENLQGLDLECGGRGSSQNAGNK
ncbi:nck-associated protein 5 [Cricetulus griseus]|nr:nck-associated protein 5 [Cricetulus griseus]